MSERRTDVEPGVRIAEQHDKRPALPAELGSADAKLVYLYLRTTSQGTIRELRDSLDMKAISLYPILETLIENGLVERQGNAYRCLP